MTMLKHYLRRHTPDRLKPAARLAWNAVDLLRVRKHRSYLHGLLFDLRGQAYQTEGMSFAIAEDQFPRSYRSRLYFDIYEAPERLLVKKWLPSSAKVLELGGCVGVLSCVINRMLADPAAHVVVEANPTLIDILTANRDRNACGFAVENCIVSRTGHGDFYLSGLMTANTKDSARGRKVRVAAKTVEQLSAEHGVIFDTIVLDIEGGEFDFFAENEAVLASVGLVLLELHQNVLSNEKFGQCIAMLERAGLRKVDQLDETEVWKRPD